MGVITPKVKSITFGTSHPSGHSSPRSATSGGDEPRADSAGGGDDQAPPATATEAVTPVGALISAP